MSRSENRHYTEKWKEKRKDHDGDKCHNAKCGICAVHKRHPKTGKYFNKKQLMETNPLYNEDEYNDEQDNLVSDFIQSNVTVEEQEEIDNILNDVASMREEED